MSRLLITGPHRYPDLARLWHRFVMRELVPAFERVPLAVEVHIFCDANADLFFPEQFPGARFSGAGPAARDFMEFYDATLNAPCDFILFLDADTFLLDGHWACSHFKAFDNPSVAAVSLVPRKGAPAIFALLCRAESYRALAAPALACRYESPENWPDAVNLQPGDFAARELAKRGGTIINIDAEESSRHIANFRGTTGIRSTRELTTRAAGEQVFRKLVAEYPAYLAAAYDNVLLGCLYQTLYHEPFAADAAGRHLGGSLTLDDLQEALKEVRDPKPLEYLRERFPQSQRNIARMAARERVALPVPSLLTT